MEPPVQNDRVSDRRQRPVASLVPVSGRSVLASLTGAIVIVLSIVCGSGIAVAATLPGHHPVFHAGSPSERQTTSPHSSVGPISLIQTNSVGLGPSSNLYEQSSPPIFEGHFQLSASWPNTDPNYYGIIIGQPSFTPGQVITSGITINYGNGYACSTAAGDTAEVIVDQFVIPANSDYPSTVAFQFECEASDGSFATEGTYSWQVTPTTPGQGYYLFGNDGSLQGFGNDEYFNYLGNLSATTLNAPIVGMATTPDGAGYWMVGADGGVFAYGDAGFYGSTGSLTLNSPIVGMTSTPDGRGYRFVAADGGIFCFGDAGFYGSLGGKPLNKPIVGMASTPDGKGYWLVASDGGIFAYGDAQFAGSMGGHPLNQPIVGMATDPGHGYWLVASDGGIFSFGGAQFFGSTGNIVLNSPIVGMTPTNDGNGYWFTASDGGVFAYGNAPFDGSLGDQGVNNVAGMVH